MLELARPGKGPSFSKLSLALTWLYEALWAAMGHVNAKPYSIFEIRVRGLGRGRRTEGEIEALGIPDYVECVRACDLHHTGLIEYSGTVKLWFLCATISLL